MTIFTKTITGDGITIELQHVSEGRAKFLESVWAHAVGKQKPEYKIGLNELDDATAATMLGTLLIFGSSMTYIKTGPVLADFTWPKSASDPTVGDAFEYFLDHFDFFNTQVKEGIAELRRPNGAVGSPEFMLTGDEQKDPLLESTASNGTKPNSTP